MIECIAHSDYIVGLYKQRTRMSSTYMHAYSVMVIDKPEMIRRVELWRVLCHNVWA